MYVFEHRFGLLLLLLLWQKSLLIASGFGDTLQFYFQFHNSTSVAINRVAARAAIKQSMPPT